MDNSIMILGKTKFWFFSKISSLQFVCKHWEYTIFKSRVLFFEYFRQQNSQKLFSTQIVHVNVMFQMTSCKFLFSQEIKQKSVVQTLKKKKTGLISSEVRWRHYYDMFPLKSDIHVTLLIDSKLSEFFFQSLFSMLERHW